ncbi:hypothetical protein [Alteromonas facilis]|uniref:hypothetical protein n=1 Tax=Alteromonas facilis TaxID=2048004 RepID=UPI000C2938E5|nr:hypothetical protein [Alteromonas facilis]
MAVQRPQLKLTWHDALQYWLMVIGVITLSLLSHHAEAKRYVIAAAELTSLYHSTPIQTDENAAFYGVYHDVLTKILHDTGLA